LQVGTDDSSFEIMARAAILVILKSKSVSGEELQKEVGALLPREDGKPAGSIDNALAFLHENGCVSPLDAADDPQKTIYAIMPAGRAFLKKELQGIRKYGRAGARLIVFNAKASLQEYRAELAVKREQWRVVRNERLELKKSMLAGGADRQVIRKNSRYKKLEKEQRHLSMVIRHIEKRLNRRIALSSTEDPGA
jgi:DNA-binding PadR family transcriptional regulator